MHELKGRLATSGNLIANVIFIIEIIIAPNAVENNLKTYCHTAIFDIKKEKIVRVSETLQNWRLFNSSR